VFIFATSESSRVTAHYSCLEAVQVLFGGGAGDVYGRCLGWPCGRSGCNAGAVRGAVRALFGGAARALFCTLNYIEQIGTIARGWMSG
jgi:hypothetical protein